MKINFTLAQLDNIVKNKILPILNHKTIFTFTGNLGVGKTTIIKSILKQSGVTQNITSPTFGYLNSYQTKNGPFFNHFDLYRINSSDEFVMSGFDEYLHVDNSICLIEWPDVIENLLNNPVIKQKTCHIKIDYPEQDFLNKPCTQSNNLRTLIITQP